MWCIKPRTLYLMSVGGVALFSALCLCSVLLPGWAAKITEAGDGGEQTVYAGLFWMCFNSTFTSASCVSGNPFEHTALEVTTKFLVLAGLLFQLLSVLVALCHLTCCCCHCCCCCRWWWWCCWCCCCSHHHPDPCNYQRYHLRRQLWHLESSVVEVLAIGGGLIFFVGSLCAVGFVMTDTEDDYTFGPSLFLALASSTLVVNFGCLVFISNRDPEDSPVFV